MTNICNVVREIFVIIVSVMVIETQKFINLGVLYDFDDVPNQRQVGSKFLNHDDEEEKTDRKANMVYSYF